VHPRAIDGSYTSAALTVVEPLLMAPPAIRMLLPKATETCCCTGATITPSVAQLVPFQYSVELSVLVPFDPPETRTRPRWRTLDGSRFMAWPHLAEVMLPAAVQFPGPHDGSKVTELAR